MTEFVADAAVRVGHVHLRVADLNRAIAFTATRSASRSPMAGRLAYRRRSWRRATTTTTSG
jgi:hypothetical protein